MRKALIKLLLTLFLLTLLVASAYAVDTTCVLPVPIKGQQHSNWCWAACSDAILTYYHKDTTQYDIAFFACTSQVWCEDCSLCYEPTAACCDSGNYLHDPEVDGDVAEVLSHFGSISSTWDGTYLTEEKIISEVCDDHKRPFIMSWYWTKGGAHALVGRGIDKRGRVHYMDPEPVGRGSYHISSYSYVCSSSVHKWSETLSLTTNGPGPVFHRIATLTQWGLVVFAGLFILSLIFMLRRKRAKLPLGA